MAVKMPVDLTQNGNTRRSLQQATDLDDRRDPSISPINPPNRALRSQVRRKVSGRLHYKRRQGTILGMVFAISRLWRELSRRGQPKKSTLVDILPRRITHEGVVLEQHIREGRFQRSLALITA